MKLLRFPIFSIAILLAIAALALANGEESPDTQKQLKPKPIIIEQLSADALINHLDYQVRLSALLDVDIKTASDEYDKIQKRLSDLQSQKTKVEDNLKLIRGELTNRLTHTTSTLILSNPTTRTLSSYKAPVKK